MKTQLLVGVLAAVVVPSVARAGSDDRLCETADKSIVMKSSSSRVEIKMTDQTTFEAPLSLQPNFGYPAGKDGVIAVPISGEQYTSRVHKEMHVTHKDGSTCEGRQSWDDRSVQTYILMSQDGEDLRRLLKKTPVKKLTTEGYVVAEFQCHRWGVTSPGGCFVNDPADQVTWVPIKPIW